MPSAARTRRARTRRPRRTASRRGGQVEEVVLREHAAHVGFLPGEAPRRPGRSGYPDRPDGHPPVAGKLTLAERARLEPARLRHRGRQGVPGQVDLQVSRLRPEHADTRSAPSRSRPSPAAPRAGTRRSFPRWPRAASTRRSPAAAGLLRCRPGLPCGPARSPWPAWWRGWRPGALRRGRVLVHAVRDRKSAETPAATITSAAHATSAARLLGRAGRASSGPGTAGPAGRRSMTVAGEYGGPPVSGVSCRGGASATGAP